MMRRKENGHYIFEIHIRREKNMRRIFCIICILCLLSACTSEPKNYLADAAFDTDEKLPQFDSQSAFCLPGSCLTEGEQAYYGRVMGEDSLSYWDKESGAGGILCGKPDCSHDDEICNGYLTAGATGLNVYDQKLYWVEKDIQEKGVGTRYLWRMNLDGTDRERLQKMAPLEVTTNVIMQIHRGYVYTAGVVERVIDGKPEENLQIYAEQIGVEEDPIVIMNKVYSIPLPYCRIKLIGNSMYILIQHYEEDQSYTLELYEWDAKTREMKTLLEEENWTVEPWSLWVTEEREIYWACLGVKETVPIQLTGRRGTMLGVYRYNLQMKNIETVSQWECTQNGFNRMTRDNVITIYYDENDDIYMQVRTFSGEMVCEREITWEGKAEENRCFLIFCGGDEEYVFYCASQGNNRWFLQVPLEAERAAEVVWEYVL